MAPTQTSPTYMVCFFKVLDEDDRRSRCSTQGDGTKVFNSHVQSCDGLMAQAVKNAAILDAADLTGGDYSFTSPSPGLSSMFEYPEGGLSGLPYKDVCAKGSSKSRRLLLRALMANEEFVRTTPCKTRTGGDFWHFMLAIPIGEAYVTFNLDVTRLDFDDAGRKVHAALEEQGSVLSCKANLDVLWEDPRTGGKVYVGGSSAAKCLDTLRRCGITHVINCLDASHSNVHAGTRSAHTTTLLHCQHCNTTTCPLHCAALCTTHTELECTICVYHRARLRLTTTGLSTAGAGIKYIRFSVGNWQDHELEGSDSSVKRCLLLVLSIALHVQLYLVTVVAVQ